MGKKACICCGRLFTPSKYNPHQKYCNNRECKKYADSVRQKRCYDRHKSDPEWRLKLNRRKKRERERRLKMRKALSAAAAQDAFSLATLNSFWQLLAGMASFVSGATEYDEVQGMVVRCIEQGQAFFPEGMPL